MEERNQEAGTTQDSIEDLFEPMLGDIGEEAFVDLAPLSSEKQNLVEKRRLAEKRLEEKRLRDELGDYDFELDDC